MNILIFQTDDYICKDEHIHDKGIDQDGRVCHCFQDLCNNEAPNPKPDPDPTGSPSPSTTCQTSCTTDSNIVGNCFQNPLNSITNRSKIHKNPSKIYPQREVPKKQ